VNERIAPFGEKLASAACFCKSTYHMANTLGYAVAVNIKADNCIAAYKQLPTNFTPDKAAGTCDQNAHGPSNPRFWGYNSMEGSSQ
jgi:hypothetical protein